MHHIAVENSKPKSSLENCRRVAPLIVILTSHLIVENAVDASPTHRGAWRKQNSRGRRLPAAVHPPAATPQPTQDMINQLEALKARTTVVADTGDFESARTHRRGYYMYI
jgi:hypothetical protein